MGTPLASGAAAGGRIEGSAPRWSVYPRRLVQGSAPKLAVLVHVRAPSGLRPPHRSRDVREAPYVAALISCTARVGACTRSVAHTHAAPAARSRLDSYSYRYSYNIQVNARTRRGDLQKRAPAGARWRASAFNSITFIALSRWLARHDRRELCALYLLQHTCTRLARPRCSYAAPTLTQHRRRSAPSPRQSL